MNLWADVTFDPPLAPPKQRAASERHPGAVSKVLAIVRDAPTSFLGIGWDTPINAGFVTKPAPDGRLFMGFSVQDRVDLCWRFCRRLRMDARLRGTRRTGGWWGQEQRDPCWKQC